LRFAGVIFDVDGTLVDSNDAHARAFVEAFREAHHQVEFADARRLIGKGSDKLVPELIGRYDEAIVERKKAIFRTRYLPGLRAFPGVAELLATLKGRGCRLAVASSAAKDELDALLEVAKARPYFERTTDADDAAASKPDPDIVAAALDALGLPAQRCVMVGDTPYDAQAAQRAGIDFIGVRCGGWGERDLEPAIAVYDDPADFASRLRSANSQLSRSPTTAERCFSRWLR
jgi:HAD superfamily hydrolase (TIGR01509 family)